MLLRDRSHVESVVEMLLGVVNKQVVQPFLFHTAAYEANFYLTIYGDEGNAIAVESHTRALDICNEWLSYAESISAVLTTILSCGWDGPQIIISSGWSMIFDQYIKVVLGFLSLVKAITSTRCNYKLSNKVKASYVIVRAYPMHFLRYLRYQCQVHLKNNSGFDQSFIHDVHPDIARMLLFTAIRINTKLSEQST